jgi:3-hydroxyacyl-[acyl-carrier-protein] dehydratase
MNELKTAIALSATGPAEMTETGTCRKSYWFKPDFIGFSGHFPGYPVLPAFIQVMTALGVEEEVKGNEIELASLVKAKFRVEIRPDQEVAVTCAERTVKGGDGFEASLSAGGALAASLLFTFRRKGR